MGRACGTYGGRNVFGGLVGKPEGKDYIQDLGVDGSNMNVILKENEWVGMDWTKLARDRGTLWAVVKTVVNFRGAYW
jgi:hypothetical protein